MKSRVLGPCHLLLCLCFLYFVVPRIDAQVISGLSADFLNASTLRINWNAASPDESIHGYNVRILNNNTEVERTETDNVTSSVQVPSLDHCNNYTVKVAANLTAGPGNYSTLEVVTRCAPPLIQPQTRTVYFRVRKAALLPCIFSGFPRPSVYWTVTHSSLSVKVTKEIPKILKSVIGDQVFEQQLTVDQNGTLRISELLAEDSLGQFQCTAENRLGLAKGDVILTLVGVISGLSADFLNASTLRINWNAASPYERIHGYNIILKDNTGVVRIETDSVTSSVQVPLLDYCNNYTVKVAANLTTGPGNYSTLEVVTHCAPPLIQPQTRTVYFRARKAALLPCIFSGFPRPSVYWTVTHSSISVKVTKEIPKILRSVIDDKEFEQQLTVYQNGTLHISELLAEDIGQFQCTAENRLGLAKGNVILTLVGDYATVKFEITIIWTDILKEHNRSGSLQMFLKQEFVSLGDDIFGDLIDVTIGGTQGVIAVKVNKNTNTASMSLYIAAAVKEGKAATKIAEAILKISDSKAIGNLTLTNVVIKDVKPPPPINLQASLIEATNAVIKWKTPPYADVYEISDYTVERKRALDNNAAFQTEKSVKTDVTELKLTGLDPDTEYLVRVVSHRENAQLVGVSESLEFKTDKDSTLTIVLAIVIPLIVIGIIVVVVVVFIKNRTRPMPEQPERRFTMDELQRMDRRTYGPPNSDINTYDYSRKQLAVHLPETDFKRQWLEVPRDFLKIAEELGAGAFGAVRKGYLMRNNKVIECAVKMLKKHGTINELRDLYNELNIMASVGNHPNIVSLIGACSEDGPLWVIVKFAENGSLLDYIRKRKNIPDYVNTAEQSGESNGLSNVEILRLAHGIAMGMNHLTKVKCVHRDLACRNVLLGKNLIPMVADFGLARDIYESGAYETTSGGKFPVRWMALESLQDYSFTSESDVWSFGVVLWEIETEGQVPYAALGGQEIVELLKTGDRLPKPERCSEEIYDIMVKCWHPNPKQRLTFEELVHVIDSLMSAEADYLEILGDTPVETEDDTPYDEVRFDRIPEEYFWPPELRIHDPQQAQPRLDAKASGDKGGLDTGF